jgi:hypothetical protein
MSLVRASVTGSFAPTALALTTLVPTALALTILVLAVAAAHAQAPPPQAPPAAPSRAAPPPPLPAPGFVSAYEIMRTLRSAGFDPLAPPLREGTIYVARATDYRGILMRVVLDARTGAIRDANRIVPGPGNYVGPYGGGYGARAYGGPYGPGPYDGAPYDAEPDAPGPDDGAGIVRLPYGLPPDANAAPAPPAAHPAASASASVTPLPRPRPPVLASRKSADEAKPPAAIAVKPDAKAEAKPDAKPAVTAAEPVVTPAPVIAPAPAKPSKAPSTLSIAN